MVRKDRVHKVGDNGAIGSLVLGIAVKTCYNILEGRRWIWFPVFASRFDNKARQPKVEKLSACSRRSLGQIPSSCSPRCSLPGSARPGRKDCHTLLHVAMSGYKSVNDRFFGDTEYTLDAALGLRPRAATSGIFRIAS